jgi:hypothetical protein
LFSKYVHTGRSTGLNILTQVGPRDIRVRARIVSSFRGRDTISKKIPIREIANFNSSRVVGWLLVVGGRAVLIQSSYCIEGDGMGVN